MFLRTTKTSGRSLHLLLVVISWTFSLVGALSTLADPISTAIASGDSSTAESFKRRRLAELNASIPSYFNQLRKEATEWQGPQDTNSTSRVFKVTVPKSSDVYRLVELKSFIPFTLYGREPFFSTSEGFAALLAVYHFNNVEKSPILNESDVSGCRDLKLTMTLLDSMFDPVQTTRLFTEMISTPKTFKNNPAAGILGAYRSSVSLPLAILTGINGMPQISPASSAGDFDDKDQYPLFGRTYCNTDGEAQVAVDFLKSIGSTHVAVLYITDTFGSSLQKAFQDAASRAGLRTFPVALSFHVEPGSTQIVQAIQLLVRSQYRHVYVISYLSQFPIIMGEAIKQGVVGPDYFYLCPSIGINEFNSMGIDAADTAMVNALSGVGIISGPGGIKDSEILAKLVPGTKRASKFYEFYDSWNAAQNDFEFSQFAKESLPESLRRVPGYNASTEFDDSGFFSMFLYDAVTSMALAMCNTPHDFFTGIEVFDEFRKTEFYGVTGPMQVDNRTGTRDCNTLHWSVWSSAPNGALPDGNASFTLKPSFHFMDFNWESIQGNTFVYASGSTLPPSSLPPVAIQYNYIGTTCRAVGYTLMGITMLSAILSVIWFWYYRNTYIVKSAQPMFLILVSLGTFTMATAILPLGFEEMVVDDEDALSKACMAVPWLYIVGATFSLSAMFVKIRGVHKAFVNPEIEAIEVTNLDFLTALGSLLLVNLIILVCWTALAPLQWTREFGNQKDEFDREIDTYGRCLGYDDEVFVILLAVVNLGFLLKCNWWVYETRNIETEFGENYYIAMSAVALLQAWSMSIPILMVVSDSPQGKFLVAACIIFVTSLSVLSIVYLPKVVALHLVIKAEAAEKKLADYHSYLEKSRSSRASGASSRFSKNSSGFANDGDSSSSDEDEANAGRRQYTRRVPVLSAVQEEPSRFSEQDPVERRESSSHLMPSVITEALSETVGAEDNPRSSGWCQQELQREQESPEQSQLRENPVSERLSTWSGRLRRGGKGTGAKITYNPRSERNLAISGGSELAREELENIMQQKKGGAIKSPSKEFRGGRRPNVKAEIIDENEEKFDEEEVISAS